MKWVEVARNRGGKGGLEKLQFAPVTACWIRRRALKRRTPNGVPLREFRVAAGAAPTSRQ